VTSAQLENSLNVLACSPTAGLLTIVAFLQVSYLIRFFWEGSCGEGEDGDWLSNQHHREGFSMRETSSPGQGEEDEGGGNEPNLNLDPCEINSLLDPNEWPSDLLVPF
jgi:hypothetical protein